MIAYPRTSTQTPRQRIAFWQRKDPIAKTMADQITPRQATAIRAISRTFRLDAEDECSKVFKCQPEDLSRGAASALIDWLKFLVSERQEAA